jgi:hypothetical protein
LQCWLQQLAEGLVGAEEELVLPYETLGLRELV